MKQIFITDNKELTSTIDALIIPNSQANFIMPALKSDYFQQCRIQLPLHHTPKDFKYFMHAYRVTKQQGFIVVKGSNLLQAKKILVNLGLIIKDESQSQLLLTKTKQKEDKQQPEKLSIGVKHITQQKTEEDQIDDAQLLKNQNINLQKKKQVECKDKPKACANCSCGRKDNVDEIKISKQQLIESINQGKLASGCGKCYLGDSFRCGTCPYKGLPAFKPGDKLQVFEEGKVIVQEGGVTLKTGKVKIQL